MRPPAKLQEVPRAACSRHFSFSLGKHSERFSGTAFAGLHLSVDYQVFQKAKKTMAAKKASLRLRADTAADLMTPNPLSIRKNAAIREAISFLVDKGFSAAPVIDE